MNFQFLAKIRCTIKNFPFILSHSKSKRHYALYSLLTKSVDFLCVFGSADCIYVWKYKYNNCLRILSLLSFFVYASLVQFKSVWHEILSPLFDLCLSLLVSPSLFLHSLSITVRIKREAHYFNAQQIHLNWVFGFLNFWL